MPRRALTLAFVVFAAAALVWLSLFLVVGVGAKSSGITTVSR